MSVLRRLALPIACFAIAGMVSLAAAADHRSKNARSNRAQLAEWYCEHKDTRCGGPSSARIESRWENRQVGYEAVVIGLGGLSLLLGAWRVRRLIVPDRARAGR
jgi:hypothetical protein